MAINKDKLCYIHKKEPYSETLQKKQGIGISNQIKECYKLLQIEITKQAWNVCSQFSSVQFSSVVQSCPTLCDPMNHSTPGFPFLHHSQNLLQFVSIELVMLSNHLILCPLLLLPSIFPSISVFSKASAPIIRWSKYRSFSNSPSNEYSTLISFRIY